MNVEQQKIANAAGDSFERRTQIVTLIGALQALVGDDFEISVKFKRQHTFERPQSPTYFTSLRKIQVKTAIMPLGEDSAFPVVEG